MSKLIHCKPDHISLGAYDKIIKHSFGEVHILYDSVLENWQVSLIPFIEYCVIC